VADYRLEIAAADAAGRRRDGQASTGRRSQQMPPVDRDGGMQDEAEFIRR
jgi:hypothetical protein